MFPNTEPKQSLAAGGRRAIRYADPSFTGSVLQTSCLCEDRRRSVCAEVLSPRCRRDLGRDLSYAGWEAPLPNMAATRLRPVKTLATSLSGCAPPTERRETLGTLANVSLNWLNLGNQPGLMTTGPTKSRGI